MKTVGWITTWVVPLLNNTMTEVTADTPPRGRYHGEHIESVVRRSEAEAELKAAVAAERAKPTRDTDAQVFFYEHDFYVLSNFSAFRLSWKGRMFDTSEAAYHWEKFPNDAELQDAILDAPSAHEAFKLAESQKLFRRPDWDSVKVDIMREILTAKASQHEYVRRKLLATGDRELVEDSWRDDFWGWGPNRDGKNMLGNLWMEVRAAIRARGAAIDQAKRGGE